jgi:glutathione S-transferase
MAPPVILFGYDSSPFTQKIRLALRLKQVPYSFIAMPSMMPRPLLHDTFHVHYRKIPICLIGRELYCDTSIILEALEHFFPPHSGYGTIYPQAVDGRQYQPLMRGFASYWTDRPFFRVTTGLIPGSVWRTSFGQDRGALIGHRLDPDKLEAKVPQNLSGLDMHLSMLEPLFSKSNDSLWIFGTEQPSLADVALFYQLDWGNDIAKGKGIYNLTGGGTMDTMTGGAQIVFNESRYPNLCRWFTAFQKYIEKLAKVENRHPTEHEALAAVKSYSAPHSVSDVLLPTPAPPHAELDMENGFVAGAMVSVAPDDTGKAESVTPIFFVQLGVPCFRAPRSFTY